MKKLALAVTLTLFCLAAEGQAQISTLDLLLEKPDGTALVTLSAPSTGSAYRLIFPVAPTPLTNATGSVLFVSSATGTDMQASLLTPGTNGQVLRLVAGLPTWQTVNVLPAGSTTNSTLVWNGTSWVENTTLTSNPTTGATNIGGDLTVTGPNVNLPAGSISNTELANSSVTINTGTGLSGGGNVALGGTLNLTNTGVTSIVAGTGVTVSGATGAVTINSSGISTINGTTNQINVATPSAGTVTLSTPQNIHTGATPTFAGMTLTTLTNDNTVPTVVVSDGGVLKTRAISSLPGGFTGVTTNATLSGLGTTGSPLGINLANPNTWTGAQTFGVLSTTGNTTLGDGGDNIGINATGGSLNLTGLTNDDTKTRVLVQDASGQVYYRTASSLAGASGWALTGNTGTNPTTNYLGTTDAQPLVLRTAGTERARLLSTGPLQLTSQTGATAELRFQEPTTGGTEYSSFKAQTQHANINYSLPDSAGKLGEVLIVKAQSGNDVTLDWGDANTGGGIGTFLFERKSADETVSGATLQDDDHLTLQLKAGTTYEVSGALYYTGSGQTALDVAWVVPGGTGTGAGNSTMLISFFGNEVKSGNSNTGAGTRSGSGVGSTASALDVNTGEHIMHFKGLVITGTTAGTLKLQWTPTSTGRSITVRTNSYMSARKSE